MSKEDEINKLLFNEKPVKILVKLITSKSYASELSNKVDATYSHTVKILQRLEKNGLVSFEEKGRKKEVTLTDEGEKYARNLRPFVDPYVEV